MPYKRIASFIHVCVYTYQDCVSYKVKKTTKKFKRLLKFNSVI